MLGHLHRLVAGQAAGEVDPVLVRQLTDLQGISAERNLRMTGVLLRLLGQLRAAGVEAMPYKGPAWAERLYGDVTLRQWMDLDLIVLHEQVPLAREVLLANGFVDAGRSNDKLIGRERSGWGGQVSFVSTDRDVHLDVHWEVTVGLSTRSLWAEMLFARADCLRLLGREVLIPSPVDLLLVTCMHAARDPWDRVESLLGLAVQVRSVDAAAWPDIMARARTGGYARRVAIAVAQACRPLGVQIPSEVTAALAHDRIAWTLLRSLGPKSLQPVSLKRLHSMLRALLWNLATEDSLMAVLGHAGRVFSAPGRGTGSGSTSRVTGNGCTTRCARSGWPSSCLGVSSRRSTGATKDCSKLPRKYRVEAHARLEGAHG